MAFCSYSDGNAMFGTTPVENMFILEYMPAAPGEFVRVYLYGLMLCHHPELNEDLSGMARALRVDEEAVLNAFRYWERQGLVSKTADNPASFEYVPLSRAAASFEPMDDVYRYRSFNQDLQMALPGMVLEEHEIRVANEWMDELHLSEDVILFMVKSEVARRGGKLPAPRTLFKHLNDTAMEWATEKISTVEEAEEYEKRSTFAAECARAVIRQFGQSRPATKDEIELAEKWTGEWKLTREDILAACADTVKSSNPSFAYLDRILASRVSGNSDDPTRENIKTLLKHLGLSTRPTPAQMDDYRAFTEMGFAFDAIEQAAIWCGENNRRTFEDIARKLEQWKKIGAFTLAEIEEERKVQKQFTDIALSIFDRCGLDKKVGASDIGQVRIWTALVELDTVLFAAECARGTDSPMKYINKLVSSWSAKGIRTLDGAQKEYALRRAAPEDANKAQTYAQREVTEDEFGKDFYVDVMNRRKAE